MRLYEREEGRKLHEEGGIGASAPLKRTKKETEMRTENSELRIEYNSQVSDH